MTNLKRKESALQLL